MANFLVRAPNSINGDGSAAAAGAAAGGAEILDRDNGNFKSYLLLNGLRY